MQLLEKAKKVIAVEVDPRMVTELRKRVAGTYVHFVQLHLEEVNGEEFLSICSRDVAVG